MERLLIGLAILAIGGILAMLLDRAPRLANLVGAASAVIGCGMSLGAPWRVLVHHEAFPTLTLPWHVPYGSFSVGLDPLSAWFAAVILGLCLLAAIYGFSYMRPYIHRKSVGASWLWYNLLAATMVLVIIARNGVLFLVAWEGMALASYFLVIFEDEKKSVRDAGRVYLNASHLGTAFLLVLFVLFGSHAGSFQFDDLKAWIDRTGGFPPAMAGLLFLLAVVGFGTKAGFMPLHVWLPEAHPAAPSHVSAVMSGAMIKTGIYGLIRAITFLPAPPQWWAWLLIGIGISSGVLGVLFALAQHDLKRLLAYHSVENIGIIAIGLGIGLLGINLNMSGVAVLGFAGALLHVANHAIFKGLLFLGAGAVLHGTGTADMEQLGGLMKRMPWTAATFLVGCVAICGLPPLNGFVSELLIYLGAFEQETFSRAAGSVMALATIGSLALIGGLAAACFTKAMGVVFLGSARSESARNAHPDDLWMRLPMLVLALLCFLVTLLARPIVFAMTPILTIVVPIPGNVVEAEVQQALQPIGSIVTVAFWVLGLALALAVVRRLLLATREVTEAGTWDCGYARPTAKMQYTASSFAQPLTDFFRPVLQTERHIERPQGLFPRVASIHTHTSDLFMNHLFVPLYRAVLFVLRRLSWIQHGKLNLYILYIALSIVCLLAWQLGVGELFSATLHRLFGPLTTS